MFKFSVRKDGCKCSRYQEETFGIVRTISGGNDVWAEFREVINFELWMGSY